MDEKQKSELISICKTYDNRNAEKISRKRIWQEVYHDIADVCEICTSLINENTEYFQNTVEVVRIKRNKNQIKKYIRIQSDDRFMDDDTTEKGFNIIFNIHQNGKLSVIVHGHYIIGRQEPNDVLLFYDTPALMDTEMAYKTIFKAMEHIVDTAHFN